MGLLLSYFRRPKDAVIELEGIELKLSRLETWRQSQLRLQKRLLGYLLLSFVLGYPAALAVYYAYCTPVTSKLALAAHAVAFLAVLPLFYCLRRSLSWLFVRSLAGCEDRMRQLREDKQHVLDRVMDTETYKRAKEILDRFDPDRFKAEFQQQPAVRLGQFFNKSPISKRQPAAPAAAIVKSQPQPLPQPQPQPQLLTHQSVPPHPQHPPAGSGIVLRQLSAVPSPVQPLHQHHQPQPLPHQSPPHQPPVSPPGQLPPPPQQRLDLPRPVLSRDRSLMDRFIDLLVGDGADRRYALICRRCCGHNGMAMAEEFPYLAWRCAYCAYMHPPRHLRPTAPPLEPHRQPQSQQPPQPAADLSQPRQNKSQHRRPLTQSLDDLRSKSAADAGVGAETQSLRSSSRSSSAASTPLQSGTPTELEKTADVKEANGTPPDGDVSEDEGVSSESAGLRKRLLPSLDPDGQE